MHDVEFFQKNIAPQSTKETIDTIRKLEKMDVDSTMIFLPMLFARGKVGDLKIKFYEDIINATATPITVFQISLPNY